jgi:hypothetical protein
MRFAKVVFTIAGVWGVLILTPLYFLFDLVGEQYPPPITHPDFYYGFLTITMVWQIAFLVIATDPLRYRPLIPVAILEKFGFIATLATLYALGRIQLGQFAVAGPDLILGLLFLTAFLKTSRSVDFQWGHSTST